MVLTHHQTQLFICKQTLHSIQQRVLTSEFFALITNLLPRKNPPSMQGMSVIIPAKHIIIIIIIIIIITVSICGAPIPVAARSKAWVYGRLLAGIVGSNPAGGMDVCLF